MILARILRDGSLRSLPIWGIAALVNSSFLLGVIFWQRAARGGAISTLTLVLLVWLGAAIYLAFGHVRDRCTAFDLALPLPTRTLWLAHVAAVVVGGAVVVGLALGAIVLHQSLLGDRMSLGIGVPALGALVGTGVVLAALLLQIPSPALGRIPVTRAYVGWTILVLATIPLLLTLAASGGGLGVGLLWLVTGGAGAWIYRSVPPAYSLAPRRPERAAGAVHVGPDASTERTGRSWLVLPLAILRGVSCGPKELLAFPFVVGFGMILGGALLTAGSTGLRELRFIYVPMVTYMLVAFVGPRLMHLHSLDALPISRRTICAALLLPYLLMVVAGYGAGAIVATGAEARTEYVDMQETEAGYTVTVPLRVHRIRGDGSAPPADSPWGESHVPQGMTLTGIGRAAAYSPYGAPPGSSERFVALQISRAVEHVYGASIPPDEIAERYLVMRDDGTVAPRDGHLTLRTDYPGLQVRSGPLFPMLTALAVVPWLLLAAVLFRAYRAAVAAWVRHVVFWGPLGLLLLLWIAISLGSVIGLAEVWVFRALIEIPLMKLGESAVGTFAVWIAALAVTSGAYLVAEGQFRRMEIPVKPCKYTLIDHLQGDG